MQRCAKSRGKQDGQKKKKPNANTHRVMEVPRHRQEDIFSLDVECVAVGRTHEKSDREPCSLALVDGFGRTVLYTLMRPSRPVVSYLTAFTGLREGDLDGARAISRARAVAELKACLPSRAVLVGQNPEGDAEWMELARGVDYQSTVDLAEVYKNPEGMAFSLRHEALVLLGRSAKAGAHDPCWDAQVSIELYQKAAQADPKELGKMRDKLTSKDFWPPKPSLARECGYAIDGVCLSCYVSKHCTCGRPIIAMPK